MIIYSLKTYPDQAILSPVTFLFFNKESRDAKNAEYKATDGCLFTEIFELVTQDEPI
jgi:hypothetical protein